ncbi:carboxypeptidase-like regulatory domain-containing protein [Edaphobacter aggregans]|uniref:carboxypeptidase-like regulatory domain-containing protein n=1 Tax=Edaphobacter aggregans TaxID=570835 RepID=UPI0005535DEA|nr:carboxypeptidase-like regulatory domain-containing protein [Edaphobacter aggregans]
MESDAGTNFPALAPGRYTVRVEQPGFETLQRSGVLLEVDTVTRVDLKLTVGNVNTTVNVTDQPSLLQPNTAETATAIGGKEYDQLPLVQQGRSQPRSVCLPRP